MNNAAQVAQSVAADSGVKNVLQDALATMITKSIQGVDSAVMFFGKELPEVIQQVLLWEFCKHSLLAVILFCIPVAFFVILSKWIKKGLPKDHYGNTGEEYHAYCAFGGVLSVIAFAFAINQVLDVVKIVVAPKLYLIQYVAEMFK